MTPDGLTQALFVDLPSQVVEVSVERGEQAFQRAPLDVDASVLQMGDVRAVGIRPGGELGLGDTGAPSQLAKRRSDGALAHLGVGRFSGAHGSLEELGTGLKFELDSPDRK